MERRYWDTYSPYQKFTIESDGRNLVSFDKEQVELVFLYGAYIQFILSHSKTVFNLELQDPKETNSFFRVFTPANQVPLVSTSALQILFDLSLFWS